MKKVVILFLFSILQFFANSQTFYEIKWTASNVKYTALIIFYSNNDAYARVKYKYNNVYKVAEYELEGKYFNQNGKKYYYLDGTDGTIMYSSDHNSEGDDYSADNFLFTDVDNNNNFNTLYAIDDKYTGDNDKWSIGQIESLNPKNFTEDFVYNYFDKDEEEYSELLAFRSTPDKSIEHPSNTALHLIIVANTLDVSIGRGCKVDRDNLSTEFGNIAHALNIPIYKTIISEESFSKTSVENAVNAVNPNSNDIVVFFYRGHGFRWNNQSTAWPQMSLRRSVFDPLESMNLLDVYNIIKGKGARLNLIFGDLCNNDIGLSKPTNTGNNSLQSSLYPDISKLKRLFLQASGNVISAAAKPGEVSWVNNSDGGLFTTSFLEALYKEVGVNTGSGDWSNLINTTIDYARYKSQYNCSNCSIQDGIKNISITY